MIDAELLRILCCPETHQPLSVAGDDLIQKINNLIREGKIKNRNGNTMRGEINGGLIRADGKYLYPVRGNTPIMLIDEAIPIEGLT